MKYNYCLPVIILLSLFVSCKKPDPVIPPPVTTVTKVLYGGSGNDFGQAIIATGDGGFVLAATTSSNDGDVSGNHGNTDFWLVKVDKTGNIIWQKTFGGAGYDDLYSMIATADGGYLLAGNTLSNDGDVKGLHFGTDGSTINNAWVVKVDGNGNLLWQKPLVGPSGGGGAKAIVASPDGGCVIAGTTSGDAWIVKLNATGSIVWQRSVGGSRFDDANGIIALENGGYVVAGSTSSEDGDIKNKARYGWFHTDAHIFEISENGILRSQSTHGGGDTDLGLSITKGNNGGYVICGSSYSFNEDIPGDITRGTLEPDAWIFKLFTNADWRKAVGSAGPDGFTSVVNVPNVGYIATGFGSLTNTDVLRRPGEVLFYAFDEHGNILSQKSHGGGAGPFGKPPTIIYTQDRNYVIAGSTFINDGEVSGHHGGADAWIIRGSF